MEDIRQEESRHLRRLRDNEEFGTPMETEEPPLDVNPGAERLFGILHRNLKGGAVQNNCGVEKVDFSSDEEKQEDVEARLYKSHLEQRMGTM